MGCSASRQLPIDRLPRARRYSFDSDSSSVSTSASESSGYSDRSNMYIYDRSSHRRSSNPASRVHRRMSSSLPTIDEQKVQQGTMSGSGRMRVNFTQSETRAQQPQAGRFVYANPASQGNVVDISSGSRFSSHASRTRASRTSLL
jgi:hypothetical protein